MKIKSIILTVVMMLGASVANAQGLGDLLKGIGDGSSTIGNVIEGIFTKSNLSIEDLAGEYESAGPAVTFKSDNFLKKAGGIAGAAALETKLQPYYEQYGLTGMPMTIDKDGNFTLTVKMLPIKGTITKSSEEGVFDFNIMIVGMRLGKFKTYIEKTGSNLNLMFDATKLKELISKIGTLSGIKMAKDLTKLLDSYEGACIGFKMKNTASGSSSIFPSTGTTTTDSTSSSSKSGVESLIEILKNR